MSAIGFDKQRKYLEHSPEDGPLIVSFSGIDGAGKTTQIEQLASWLREAGFRVRMVRYWDDAAALRRWRELAGHTLFKGDHGVGTPEKPVARRDKNVQTWYMLVVRLFLCFLDAVRLQWLFADLTQGEHDVVIFDRYIYDQIANLNLKSSGVRTLALLLLKCAPRPGVAYLLDADPSLARSRKPEYPIEFLQWNRNNYLTLGRMAGMCVVSADTAVEVAATVRKIFVSGLTQRPDINLKVSRISQT